MMIHHRIVASMRDILALRLDCQCGAAISFSPDAYASVAPRKCPSCQNDWPPQHSEDDKAITALIQAMKKARQLHNGLTMGLEIEFPTSEE